MAVVPGYPFGDNWTKLSASYADASPGEIGRDGNTPVLKESARLLLTNRLA
jgi:hypothetical protein